jgi:hypothetical protein
MKYQVSYLKLKKKGKYTQQSAVFYTIEDAIWYEGIIQSQGAKEVIITPK